MFDMIRLQPGNSMQIVCCCIQQVGQGRKKSLKCRSIHVYKQPQMNHHLFGGKCMSWIHSFCQPQGAMSQCQQNICLPQRPADVSQGQTGTREKENRWGLSFASLSSIISKLNHLEKSLKTWWGLGQLGLSLRPSLNSVICQAMFSVHV